MATISKARRLVNPGSKIKLSPLQKLFFGSKRQRAAVANSGSMKRTKKRLHRGSISAAHAVSKIKSHIGRKKKRNVGSIITVWPNAKSNPGRTRRYKRRNSAMGYKGSTPKRSKISASSRVLFKKRNKGKKVIIVNTGEKMATKRRVHRRRRAVAKVTVRRRRRNYGTVVGRSFSNTRVSRRKKRNPGMKRYSRRRRSNPGIRRHRRSYRRNPGMLTGTAGRVLGVVGGVGLTKLLCGFLPAPLNSGVLGYLATAAVATLQGKMIGKFSKNAALGNDMFIGGLAYLAARVLNDFFPSIGGYTGISGMGLIGGSSFYTPQVNVAGNMGAFQIPAATSGYVGSMAPAAAKGVGSMRRTGRLM